MSGLDLSMPRQLLELVGSRFSVVDIDGARRGTHSSLSSDHLVCRSQHIRTTNSGSGEMFFMVSDPTTLKGVGPPNRVLTKSCWEPRSVAHLSDPKHEFKHDGPLRRLHPRRSSIGKGTESIVNTLLTGC